MNYRDIHRALLVAGLAHGNDSAGGGITLEALVNLKRKIEEYCITVVHSGDVVPSEVSSAYFRIKECLNNHKTKRK